MTQCAAHTSFERMLQQGIDNLGENIKTGIESLNRQSAENGKALSLVLQNQADRRELCGKQGARLDAAEEDIKNLWKVSAELRRLVYMGVGGIVVIQLIITVGSAVAVRLVLR